MTKGYGTEACVRHKNYIPENEGPKPQVADAQIDNSRIQFYFQGDVHG